jgi:hypothetical protein
MESITLIDRDLMPHHRFIRSRFPFGRILEVMSKRPTSLAAWPNPRLVTICLTTWVW